MISKLFYNGTIYTMDKSLPKAEAVLIKDNVIEYVGNLQTAKALCDENTEKYDLKGKMLLPGFIDAHCHPSLCAFFACGVQLDVEMGQEEICEAIREYIEENPDRDSYFGIGYAEWKFDKNGPQKKDLDSICKDKPIMIAGSGGHEAWCNSKTFELAGITKDTKDPIPGFHYFQRNEEGEPSGQVVETSSQGMIFDKVEFFDESEIAGNYINTFKDYAQMGVTSLANCGEFPFMEKYFFEFMDQYLDQDIWRQRMTASVFVAEKGTEETAVEELKKRREKYNSDRFKVDTYKIILDGTVESRSAAMMEPYEEDGSNADPLFEGEEIEKIFLAAAKENEDINCHAIGDKAIHEALRGAKAVRDAGYDDVRISISHTEHVLDSDLGAFAKYNVTANTTCVWHYGNPDMYKIVGKRAEKQFRLKSIIKAGGRMSLGSDRPVDEYGPEPLKGIQVGMNRQLYGKPDGDILPPDEERLSLQDCLEGYTCNAAYAIHMEDKIGSIEKGKYADFVVLEEDLFHVDKYESYKVPVVMTMVNGRITYSV